MKPILLIDSSHWFYQLVFRMPTLSTEDRETGIIFGMMLKTIQHAKKLGSNKFIFCFDSKKNHRKKIFPEYKIKRNKQKRTAEEIQMFKQAFIQLNEFRMQVLPRLGIKNNFIQTGHESDDIIASIILNNPSLKFIIVSNDEDLWQLLSDKVRMYNSKADKFYTNKDFEKEWGIKPAEWADIKKFGGCKSDEVPGPAGGFKTQTALKFYKQELANTTEFYKIMMSEEGMKIAEINERLVRLPFENTSIFDIDMNWKLDMKDFIGWLQQSRANFAKELVGTLTPEEIKAKTIAAVAGKSGKSLIAFKEVMDSLKKESYVNGQLSIFDHMIQMAEEQVKNFEAKES